MRTMWVSVDLPVFAGLWGRARQVRASETCPAWAEMEIDAKRYLGEVLQQQAKNRGGGERGVGRRGNALPAEQGIVSPPTLADLTGQGLCLRRAMRRTAGENPFPRGRGFCV